MDRNKRPALTSPWKIGFLVSLLLVVVSIGVGIVITRTFDVTWSWVELVEGTFVFDKEAFLGEMLPLVVLVPLMALVACFLITGAVRRYKSYLDSGLDYKHLLNSVKQVEDLGEESIKSLSGYPELKDFLFNIGSRIREREKALAEKESSLNLLNGQIKNADHFKAELGVLIGAIKRGSEDGFKKELALTIEELKQIESAIVEHLVAGKESAATDSSLNVTTDAQMLSIRNEYAESSQMLKLMMTGIIAEMEACRSGVDEIEQNSNQLKAEASLCDTGRDETGAADLVAVFERFDRTTEALVALGEETKRVAINTSLHAGTGEDGVENLVALADGVRDVAARFGGIAEQYRENVEELRISTLTSSASKDNSLYETITTTSDKIGLWGERMVVLAEKMNAFEKRLQEDTSEFEAKLGSSPEPDEYQTISDLSIEDNTQTPELSAEEPVVEEFELQETERDTLEPKDVSLGVVTGLERDDNKLFEEIGTGSGEEGEFVAETGSGTIELSGESEETGDAREETSTVEPSEEVREPASTAVDESSVQSESPSSEVDTFLEVESNLYEPTHEQADDGQSEYAMDADDSETAETSVAYEQEPQTEEKIYNLYELGAVDYEQSVHQ